MAPPHPKARHRRPPANVSSPSPNENGFSQGVTKQAWPWHPLGLGAAHALTPARVGHGSRLGARLGWVRSTPRTPPLPCDEPGWGVTSRAGVTAARSRRAPRYREVFSEEPCSDGGKGLLASSASRRTSRCDRSLRRHSLPANALTVADVTPRGLTRSTLAEVMRASRHAHARRRDPRGSTRSHHPTRARESTRASSPTRSARVDTLTPADVIRAGRHAHTRRRDRRESA
jgi:hypothetical protein